MKYIENSKNYYASICGNIYRNNRKLQSNRGSYNTVKLSMLDGTKKDFYVHRLIATVYIPNPENKPYVNHIDGDKRNNAVSNIEWCTAKENSRHAVDSGLIKTGFDHQNAVLTETIAHDICKHLSEGYRVCDVVKNFGVSQALISSIKTGHKYTEISSKYTFPEKKRTISDETVRWVCKMLEEGKRFKEISKLSNNPKITKFVIDSILSRRCYNDISINYNF